MLEPPLYIDHDLRSKDVKSRIKSEIKKVKGTNNKLSQCIKAIQMVLFIFYFSDHLNVDFIKF